MELTHGAIESPDPEERNRKRMSGIPCPLLRAESSKEKTTMGSHLPRSPGRQLMFALGIGPIGSLLKEIRRGEVYKREQEDTNQALSWLVFGQWSSLMAQTKAQTQKNATEKECVVFHVFCLVHSHPKKTPP